MHPWEGSEPLLVQVGDQILDPPLPSQVQVQIQQPATPHLLNQFCATS